MNNPLISIVVANFNGRRFLERCVNSLLAQEFQDFEIVMVDNASADDSLQLLEQTFPAAIASGKLRVIAHPVNTGCSGGNNLGVRHARGRLIVMLNNDTEALPGWLQTLKETYEANCGTVAAVGGLVLNIGAEHILLDFVNKDMLKPTMSLCGETIIVRQTEQEEHSPLKNVFYAGVASLIYSKEELGEPFDDVYFAYAEDACLGWRIRLRGRGFLLCTTARILHHGSSVRSQNKAIRDLVCFHGAKNMMLNFLLFYHWTNLLRVGPLLCLTQLARVVYEPPRFLAVLKAVGWILGNLKLVAAKRRAIQAQRKVPDRDIIRLMSCKFNEPDLGTGPISRGMVRVMNRLFHAYCWITGIRTREFFRESI